MMLRRLPPLQHSHSLSNISNTNTNTNTAEMIISNVDTGVGVGVGVGVDTLTGTETGTGLELVQSVVQPKLKPHPSTSTYTYKQSICSILNRLTNTIRGYMGVSKVSNGSNGGNGYTTSRFTHPHGVQLTPCTASTEYCTGNFNNNEKADGPVTPADSDRDSPSESESVCSEEEDTDTDDDDEYSDSTFIINPYGGWCALWSCIMLCCIVLNALLWPVGLSYASSNPRGSLGLESDLESGSDTMKTFYTFFSVHFWMHPLVLLTYISDVLLILDYILHSVFIGYYDNAELVVDRGLIWGNYRAMSGYGMHVLSLLPLDLVLYTVLVCVLPSVHSHSHSHSDAYITYTEVDTTSFSAIQWLSFVRLLKILRVWELPCHWYVIEVS